MELKNVISQKKYNELLNSSNYYTYDLTFFNFLDKEIEHKTKKALYSTILPKYYTKENNEFYFLKKELIEDFMQLFYNHIQTVLTVKTTEKKTEYFLLTKKEKKLEKKKVVNKLIQSEYLEYYSDNKFNETIFKSDYIKELIKGQISIKELIIINELEVSSAVNSFEDRKLVTKLIDFEIQRVLYCLLDNDYTDDLENQSSIFKNIKYKKNEQLQSNKTISTVTQLKFKGNQTQLVELVKALVESEMIEGTQTNAIEQFSKFFDIEINNPNKLIQDIKGKNTDSTTAFLDLLKSNLIEYLRK
tara:strand:- start:172 stop:1077 length:906 start_codon:yes stop_codon:yes gene_type:complete